MLADLCGNHSPQDATLVRVVGTGDGLHLAAHRNIAAVLSFVPRFSLFFFFFFFLFILFFDIESAVANSAN
jgi:hypothetical protein